MALRIISLALSNTFLCSTAFEMCSNWNVTQLSKDTKEVQKLLISNNARTKATSDAIARDFRHGAVSRIDNATVRRISRLWCGRHTRISSSADAPR
ncbi:hypothetical protein Y032_0039g146 [Ancylostoma ceylanicum]|uniref:Mos1 transposase HTH domain-containing protein n=1 Tax=Ancylostoma ceylanicum TaxID=53326 RepID=A0A016UHW8_9BILA|nr:hypothetical protein Y032_0039g146 [Ancylostoma ceylanicum]